MKRKEPTMTIKNKSISLPFPRMSWNGVLSQDLLNVYTFAENGTNTANFRRIKKKNLPVNPVTLEVVKRSPGTNNSWVLTSSSAGKVVKAGYSSFVYDASYPSLAQRSLASSAALSKLAGKLGDLNVNLAQSFGERGQLVNMLASTAARITRCYRYLRKGELGSAFGSLNMNLRSFQDNNPKGISTYWFEYRFERNPAKAAANLFLEMQYGWRPLLSDLYGSAKLLAETNVARESDSFLLNKTIKVSHRWHDNVLTTSSNTPSLIYRTNRAYNIRTTYGITYLISNPLLRYSAMMGMTNPLLLAYELTPFSFIYDWFHPIGKYLENIQYAYGLTFVKGSSSQLSKTITTGFTRSGSSNLINPGDNYSVSIGGNTESILYTRGAMSNFPHVPFPEFKNPVSVEHAANAVALLLSTLPLKGKF